MAGKPTLRQRQEGPLPRGGEGYGFTRMPLDLRFAVAPCAPLWLVLAGCRSSVNKSVSAGAMRYVWTMGTHGELGWARVTAQESQRRSLSGRRGST